MLRKFLIVLVLPLISAEHPINILLGDCLKRGKFGRFISLPPRDRKLKESEGILEVPYGVPSVKPLDLLDGMIGQLFFPETGSLYLQSALFVFPDCALVKASRLVEITCPFGDQSFMRRFVCRATGDILNKIIKSDSSKDVSLNIVSFASAQLAPLTRVLCNLSIALKKDPIAKVLGERRVFVGVDSIDPLLPAEGTQYNFKYMLQLDQRGKMNYFSDKLVLQGIDYYRGVGEYRAAMNKLDSDKQTVCLGYGFNSLQGSEHNVDYARLLAALFLHRKNTQVVLAHVDLHPSGQASAAYSLLEKVSSFCITDHSALTDVIKNELQVSCNQAERGAYSDGIAQYRVLGEIQEEQLFRANPVD